MEDQVSAVVRPGYENGKRFLEISFLAICGCRWVVDMWGNVRSVAVCSKCMRVDLDFGHQLNLELIRPLAADE